jgi:purine-binding chemotaxis protein CheW
MSDARRTPVSAEELAARADELSRVPETSGAARGDEVPMIVMRLGNEWLAVRAAQVREVVAHPLLTPLPMAPECVAGVMNLRGEILAALDVKSLLGLGRNTSTELMAVVVLSGDITGALLVDAVDDVEPFMESARETIVPTLSGNEARLFRGAFRATDRLITELDVDALLNHDQLEGVRETADSGRTQ